MISTFLIVAVMLLGVAVMFAAFVWNCVVCARQGVVWLLAWLFVPFAALVFLVKFWDEAKRPFFLSLAGCALMFVPMLFNPQALSKGIGERLAAAGPAANDPDRPAASPGRAPVVQPSLSETMQREQAALEAAERRQRQAQEARAAYEKHRAEADALYKDLAARRAKLKVDDAAAVATFNADAARYAALLAQTKAERDALEAVNGNVVPATATSAVAAAPVVNLTPAGNARKAAVASPETAGLYRRSLDTAARTAREASERTAEAPAGAR